MARPDQNDRTTIERVDPLLGTVLDGKYRLEFRLAAGGFGAIYRARHVESNVELAVKIIHGRLASDPGVVARFRREGEALTALRSPHTITAYELGETEDGVLYIAMELLNGVSLFERYRVDGPFSWRRMASISIGVCESLAEAHRLGIVHRDLKPTNIHLERRGAVEDFVKVLDFGIAKILQHSPFDNTDLTSAGLMIGTIDYMSPEQMVGGEITGASDLYTYGIVMYEMIAGRRPFPEAASSASALAALFKPPPPLSSAVIVPAEMNRIVMKCLERDPELRYETAEELAEDLRDLLEPVEGPTHAFSGRDEDATQIAHRAASPATIMVAAAPPPTSSPAMPLPPAPISPRGRGSASQPPAPASTFTTTTLPMAPLPASTPGKTPTQPPLGKTPTQPPLSRMPTPTPPPLPAVRRSPTVPPMQVTLAMPPVPAQAPPPRTKTPSQLSSPAVQLPALQLPPLRTPPPGAAPGAGQGSGSSSILSTPVDTLRGLPVQGSRELGGRDRREPTHPAADPTFVDGAARRRQYDPSGMARRDALVRRLLWSAILVIATVIATVLVMRL